MPADHLPCRRAAARAAVVVVAVLALALAACSDGGDDPEAAPTGSTTAASAAGAADGASGSAADGASAAGRAPVVGPDGDAFYVPPADLAARERGDVLWVREVPAEVVATPGVRAWKVLYRSEAVDGEPIAVSGLVAAPAEPATAPEGGRPVMSWAHGTTGTADACAPSKGPGPQRFPFLAELAARGYVVTATDYEGLGTPGVHPYMVGESEGRAVLDLTRAVRALPDAAAGDRSVIYGLSQGGHAALFAGWLAAEEAPELDVLGVVASAPPTSFSRLSDAGPGIPSNLAGFTVLILGAWADTYGLSLDGVLKPEVIERLPEVLEQRCIGEVFGAFGDVPDGVFLAPPGPSWQGVADANSVPTERYPLPVLVVQGTADVIVSKAGTDRWVAAQCANGATLAYDVVDGAQHGLEMMLRRSEIIDWVDARFRGDPAPTTC